MKGSKRVRRSTLACALSVAALVAACGGDETDEGAPQSSEAEDSTAVFEKFNAMSGTERKEALIEAAQAEGAVSVYTSNTNIDEFAEGFQSLYDIEVETYRAGSEALLQRVLQEQEAGYYGADVVEDAEAAVVAREGLAGEYVNDELTSQIRGFEEAEGLIPTRIGVYIVAWNTDAVSDEEIPETIEGFADPKWEGRLSMEVGDWAWYLGMHEHMSAQGKSDEEIQEIFRTLASYSTMVSGHPLQSELLAAGEYDVALSSYPHYYPRLQEGGAPVAFQTADGRMVEPVVAVQEGSVPLKTAPHPAAALLFIDYMLTDGQQLMVEQGRVPSVEQPNDNLAGLEFEFPSKDEYFDNREQWDTEYRDLLGDQEVVE